MLLVELAIIGEEDVVSIEFTGTYPWDTEQQMSKGFRPLRLPGKILRGT